jgi:hypothetical protein
MRYGYAILLGENLPADEIDYGDCADEQIVCPECSSPVYKTMRPAGDSIVHFLSHYRRDEALGEECSLRVDSGPRGEIEVRNAASRQQTLDVFMAHIRLLIAETVAGQIADQDIGVVRAIERQKAMAPMVPYIRRTILKHGVETLMRLGQGNVRGLMMRHVGEYDPGFGHAIQLRISTDVLRMLMSPTAASGLDALVRASYMLTALTRNPNESGPEAKEEMRRIMIRAATTSRGKASAIFRAMEATNAHPMDLEAPPGARRSDRMFDAMIPVMVAILYRVDYRSHLVRVGRMERK